MALTIYEIREAALSGKSFTLTDIKLIDMSYDNGKLSFEWRMPEMQNKPYCPGMVVDYISICEQPKYDPCRKFKKGDKVRIRKVNGNLPKCRYNGVTVKDGTIGEINSSGERNCYWVKFNRTTSWCLDCAYFELVTPVEELEPYYVEEKDIEYQVRMEKGGLDCLISVFRYHNYIEGYKQYYDILPTMKQAKAAAEAECARLNEEYRKKYENEN